MDVVRMRCPNCTQEFAQRVDQIRSGWARRCSRCGFRIVFKDDGGQEYRQQADKRPARPRRPDAKL